MSLKPIDNAAEDKLRLQRLLKEAVPDYVVPGKFVYHRLCPFDFLAYSVSIV